MKQRRQIAALPYKVSSGGLKVCLITSRDTGRWIVPKGWPEDGMKPSEVAALEAYEEAGLKGEVSEKSVGSFHYDKVMDDGSTVDCKVRVFPMQVERQKANWPEKSERKKRWVDQDAAVDMLDDDGLRLLVKKFRPPKKALAA